MNQTILRSPGLHATLVPVVLAVVGLGFAGCDARPLWLDDETGPRPVDDDFEDVGRSLGAACSHFEGSAPQWATATAPAAECASRVCVFAESFEPKSETCLVDSDCNAAGNIERFQCQFFPEEEPGAQGRCRLRPEYVAERSMCSAACEEDLDCDGAARDTTCNTGFSCRVMTSLGALCCKKMCVCNDGLAAAQPEALICEQHGNQCPNTMDKFRAALLSK